MSPAATATTRCDRMSRCRDPAVRARRLHLSAGILEHQTLTESIDRDRDLAGYTANRIAELQEQTRGRLTTKPPSAGAAISPAAAESLAPLHHRDIPAPGCGLNGPPR